MITSWHKSFNSTFGPFLTGSQHKSDHFTSMDNRFIHSLLRMTLVKWGLIYNFRGTGAIDYVRLRNGANKPVYEEEFDH